MLFYTNEPSIPWELATFEGALIDNEAPQFLCTQVNMGRWWLSPGVPSRPPAELTVNKLTNIAGNYSGKAELKQVQVEKKLLKERYHASILPAKLEAIENLVFGDKEPGHALHFSIHGDSRNDATETALVSGEVRKFTYCPQNTGWRICRLPPM